MSTNPQAADKTKITFQLSRTEKAQLEALMGACIPPMRYSEYLRALLIEAIQTNRTFEVRSANYSETETFKELRVAEANESKTATPVIPTIPQPDPSIAKTKSVAARVRKLKAQSSSSRRK